MSKPETTFYRGVHQHLPASLHHEKMHNPYFGGTWDVWYSGMVRDLWVEYKYVVCPKRATTLVQPGLSALQLEWGAGRHAEGRELAVIVGCHVGRAPRGVILIDRDWEEPLACLDFTARLLTREQIAAWIVGHTSTST